MCDEYALRASRIPNFVMLPRSSLRFPNKILSHWYTVVDGVQFSAQDFYDSVLDELAVRKLPQLKSSRVEYHEGGMLSDKRIYLRLARERYAFDICAAPCGEEYFFSVRFVEVPRGGWLKLIGLLLITSLIGMGATRISSDTYWWILLGLIVVLLGRWILGTARNKQESAASGRKPLMPDFDSFFLGLPILGEWYERVRKNTYFRHDTRMLYHSIISEIVKAKVDEFAAAKGVKLLRTYDYNPILGELYKPAMIKPGANQSPA